MSFTHSLFVRIMYLQVRIFKKDYTVDLKMTVFVGSTPPFAFTSFAIHDSVPFQFLRIDSLQERNNRTHKHSLNPRTIIITSDQLPVPSLVLLDS